MRRPGRHQGTASQAAQKGPVSGFADGTFRPLATINRAELAALLVRAAGLQGPSDVESSAPSFSDADQIPKWAVRYIAIAVDEGLLQGVSCNRFDATGIVTRAQAAAIMRLLNDFAFASGQLHIVPYKGLSNGKHATKRVSNPLRFH
ncbi:MULTISPECIES: S-layer homology domain-containing protein [unclassified Cohnella]|uniref:S-layer homology domain-containing protein n=1 Tax=Cohnella sp. OV330 TaxID=1855288 RepID=UPI001160C30B